MIIVKIQIQKQIMKVILMKKIKKSIIKIKELKAKDTKNEIELVTSDDGKEFADNIGAFFLETSAKESAPGFEELIHKLVEQYNRKRNPTKKKKKFSLKNDESTSDTEHKSKCCGD